MSEVAKLGDGEAAAMLEHVLEHGLPMQREGMYRMFGHEGWHDTAVEAIRVAMRSAEAAREVVRARLAAARPLFSPEQREAARKAWEAAGCPSQFAGPADAPPSVPATRRSDKDFAIEHAGYMANAARNLLERINAEDAARMEHDERGGARSGRALDAAMDSRGEAVVVLRDRIYGFEQRRDRAAAAGVATTALTYEQKAAMHEIVSNAGGYTSGLLQKMWEAALAAGGGVPVIGVEPTDEQLDAAWDAMAGVAQHILHDVPESQWDAALRREFARTVLRTYAVGGNA